MAAEAGSPPTDRVVAVVQFLASRPDRTHSLTEIARAAEVTTATCHAILASLARAGWAVRVDRGYGLGPAMLALGRAAESGYPVARVAGPELERLADTLGMVATSSVLDGTSIVVVGAAGEPSGAASLVGHRIPFAPPIGMVFAAWGGERRRESWLRGTASDSAAPDAGTEEKALADAIKAAQRRGYVIEGFTPVFLQLRHLLTEVVDDERLQEAAQSLIAKLGFAEFLPEPPPEGATIDVTVIGAPVFGPSGHAVANLSVHPGRDLGGPELTAIAKELAAAAARVTKAARGD